MCEEELLWPASTEDCCFLGIGETFSVCAFESLGALISTPYADTIGYYHLSDAFGEGYLAFLFLSFEIDRLLEA